MKLFVAFSRSIPDICEIAQGTAEDCDGDGIPDVCTKGGLITLTSGTLPAAGYDTPQIFVIDSPPNASGTVSITIEAIGDLSGANEYLVLEVNTQVVGTVFNTGTDCSETPPLQTIEISSEVFNDFALQGEVILSVLGTVAVDPEFCAIILLMRPLLFTPPRVLLELVTEDVCTSLD